MVIKFFDFRFFVKTIYIMGELIYLDEIRLRRSITEAETALSKARTMVAKGVHVPENLMERLEYIIEVLEEKLAKLILDN